MTNKFLLSLIERVATTFLFTFFATFALSIGSSSALNTVAELSSAQKALVAAGAAVVQLILSVFVGSQVGDPNSASLVPNALLHRINATPDQARSVVVSVDDVIQATLSKVAKKYPGVTATADEIANEIIADALKTPVTP